MPGHKQCHCGCRRLDKSRGVDGRRFYRCRVCGSEWSMGLQGRRQRYAPQRTGPQFAAQDPRRPSMMSGSPCAS